MPVFLLQAKSHAKRGIRRLKQRVSYMNSNLSRAYIHNLKNSNQTLFVTCVEYNKCRLYREMLTCQPLPNSAVQDACMAQMWTSTLTHARIHTHTHCWLWSLCSLRDEFSSGVYMFTQRPSGYSLSCHPATALTHILSMSR